MFIHYFRLYYSELVTRTSHFMRVVSLDVTYPPANHSKMMIITEFEVQDKYLDGHGGYAFLTHGGLGYPSVTFHLQSRRNRGFEFNITIFGTH